MNSPTATPRPGRTSPEPFQATIITLSAALLVLFGIVIGRFIVTTQAVEVVDHFDADLTSLKAQVVDLNRQLVSAQSQALLAQQSADRYRQLATQQQIRADKMAARKLMINQTINHIRQDRQTCLEELQQHTHRDRAIPAGEVLRFAESMFSTYTAALEELAASSDTPTTRLPSFPRLRFDQTATEEPPVASDTARHADRQSPPTTETLQSQVRLPAPVVATTPVAAPARPQSRGVFFAPPQPRRQPSRYTYFSARKNKTMAARPQSSGIRFLDTADAGGDTVRR